MLSEEEKKAIEELNRYIKEKDSIYGSVLETIASIIEKQQAEIEKKDKIIYEIAKSFKQDDIRSTDEIIEYFTKLVEEETNESKNNN